MPIRHIDPSENFVEMWTVVGVNSLKLNMVIKDWERFMERIRKNIPAIFVAKGNDGKMIEVHIEIDNDVKTLGRVKDEKTKKL